MDKFRIIGAGLAGMLAACRWPEATIYEAQSRALFKEHKALLRFRDESVSALTGVPFRRVRVDKAIWEGGIIYNECSIHSANRYARKVTGAYTAGRSIWNLTSDTRYVAPEGFQVALLSRFHNRIAWDAKVSAGDISRGNTAQTVSTMPMARMLEICGDIPPPAFNFTKRAINVARYRLPDGTDLHQTIYFPAFNTFVYRASITGDVLIIEAMVEPPRDYTIPEADELGMVMNAFGLDCDAKLLDKSVQQHGKIIDLPENERHHLMHELTREYNVYSLGRFAQWRNILLDDVVKDLDFIDRLMNVSAYGRSRIITRNANFKD